jgi:glucose 1-dehydrogenase
MTKTVLITGAAGGIGRATVALFAERGWKVVGMDRFPFNLASAGKKKVAFPEPGLFLQSEISDPGTMQDIFNKVKEFSSVLHALVSNAAIQIAKPLIETTVEEWDMVMANNLRPAFLLAHYFHPLLKASGAGAIINVSSVHAVQTSANIAAYAASKGGLLALTRAEAIEFAKDNIRVNAVLPGAVDTPMLRAGLDRGHLQGGNIADRLDNLASRTVNGRIGQPAEIAHAIYFLADESQSSFMTGQALTVDGGATAKLSTE